MKVKHYRDMKNNNIDLSKLEWLILIRNYKNEISNNIRHANNRYFEFLLLLIGLLVYMVFSFDIFFFFVGFSMVFVPIVYLAITQRDKYHTFIFPFICVSIGWIMIIFSGCLILCFFELVSIDFLSLLLFSTSTFGCLILVCLLLANFKISFWAKGIQISLETIVNDVLLNRCDNDQIKRRFLMAYGEILLADQNVLDIYNQIRKIKRKR